MSDLQARDLAAPDRSATSFYDELTYARELPVLATPPSKPADHEEGG
jgi:hypothetical protein